ncbi:MAG: 5-(carboxyamino)imidazole ribonucleotide synthase [Raineya sp.]|jgi:5-(carboxyamino)imidazole ribonucleotide synthase|nr:5-(carboxyamino)imidazole ribonucleotide synthase [Raineya sp.]
MLKIGILGGGQLGQMFLQNAYSYPFEVYILDPDSQSSCSKITTHFTQGSLKDFDQVYEFGKQMDVVTIEIETVNTDALKKLVSEGKKVYPQPEIIELIANKRLQKQFFKDNHLPTADFVLIDSQVDLEKNIGFLPAFQKLAQGGYDGKGVQQLKSAMDFDKAFTESSLLEKKVEIEKEIAVIVARNQTGMVAYEPCEMVFDEKLNLVDYLIAPARLTEEQSQTAQNLAKTVIEKLDMTGILAVEMFLDVQGNILLNELAPRPHNSGHHTIEAAFCSQFDQHLRSITGLPLGNPLLHSKAGMLNILGEEGYTGKAHYQGLENALKTEKVYLHLYNKHITKPGRKMGHFTVLGDTYDEIEQKIQYLKKTLRVISYEL